MRSASLKQAIAAVFLLSSTNSGAGPTPLAAGSRITRVMPSPTSTRAEVHSYELRAMRGDFVRVSLVRGGHADLVASVTAPSGARIVEAGAQFNVRYRFSFQAGESGVYRIDVRAEEGRISQGDDVAYDLTAEDLRQSVSSDQKLLAADTAMIEGNQLQRMRSPEKWSEMAALLYGQALALHAEREDPTGQAEAYTNLATISFIHDDHERALEYDLKALHFARLAGDFYLERSAMQTVAFRYETLGRLDDALSIYQESRNAARARKDTDVEHAALSSISSIQRTLGYLDEFVQTQQDLLEGQRSRGDRAGEAQTLAALSHFYLGLDDLDRAMDFRQQAIGIHRATGNRRGEAIALTDIAAVEKRAGSPIRAIDTLEQSLKLFQAIRFNFGEAYALRRIGLIYIELADYPKALEYLNRAVRTSPSPDCESLRSIAETHNAMGEPNRSLELLVEMLNRCDQRPGLIRAMLYSRAAPAFRAAGDVEKATDLARRALEIVRSVEPQWEADILALLAEIERDRGNLHNARTNIERTLEIYESLRSRIVSLDLRASYFKRVHRSYEVYIDVLMRLHGQRPKAGLDRLALRASEMVRARTLVEMLAGANADLLSGVDPELTAREQRLRFSISEKAERASRSQGNAPASARAKAEMRALTEEYERVEAAIRKASPRYDSLTLPAAIDVQEIHEQVDDHQTLLLEFALGETQSFLWAIAKDRFESFILPPRATIEAAARELYESVRNRTTTGPDKDQRSQRAATALGRMLLQPAAELLETRRLVIVADGALHYIPFSALADPNSTSDFLPLMLRHEIVMLPSASALPFLRNLSKRSTATSTMAVFADPVFDKDDPRVSGRTAAPSRDPLAAQSMRRSAISVDAADGQGVLARLPYSRREAKAITGATAKKSVRQALDFDASLSEVLSPQVARHRILHFATHGLLNSEEPRLSGLALSLVDKRGAPQNGFLRLNDIYKLRLSADMIVLSACQTALGKEIRGEGLVGLTRGFMYAGVPRVVASLWRVDDVATSQLMERFYVNLLGKNLRASSALRAAQIEMYRQKRWQSAYYWAGFTLQGDWR